MPRSRLHSPVHAYVAEEKVSPVNVREPGVFHRLFHLFPVQELDGALGKVSVSLCLSKDFADQRHDPMEDDLTDPANDTRAGASHVERHHLSASLEDAVRLVQSDFDVRHVAEPPSKGDTVEL